jgi:predicted transcriptional regulator
MTYEECCAEGMTQAETARARGVSREAVRQYADKHSLSFPKGRNRGVPHNGHESYTAAAAAEGITPQAVWNRENA